jgi:mRNA interferase RelE/StbE
MIEYRLLYSETSRKQVIELHPEIKTIIRSRLNKLQREPYCGKKLERELSGFRSLRARRFRIIYKIKEISKIIEIHYVGHRKDIYDLFSERSGHLSR